MKDGRGQIIYLLSFSVRPLRHPARPHISCRYGFPCASKHETIAGYGVRRLAVMQKKVDILVRAL